MPKLRLGDVELFFEVQGVGEPLLLISGFGCDRTIWAEMVPRLAGQYQVICFDHRGVGQSSCSDAPIDIRRMAEDVRQLLDALKLDSVHLAGHSMGGMIAQELAIDSPRRVRSLMLLSSGSESDTRGQAIIELWGELPGLVDPTTMTRLLLPWLYTSKYYERPGAVENLIKMILANRYPPSARALYEQSRAISQFNSTGRLGEITFPTLVLVGSDDILLPVGASKRMAKGIAGSKFVVLEKTGHGMLVESPEQVAGAMLDFLMGVQGRD